MRVLKQFAEHLRCIWSSTKAITMDNILRINATQWVTAYPETIPSCLEQLRPWLPAREAQRASVHSAAAVADSTAMEALLRQLLRGSLQAVGLFHDKMPIPIDEATGLPHLDTGLLPLYDRWLAESLAILKDVCHASETVGPCPW